MIRSLSASAPSFRTVPLSEGMNVILADRTKESTRRDTRNGLGKSTFVEIVHFCLGGSPGKGLTAEALRDWEFVLELDVAGRTVEVSRSVSAPGRVRLRGHSQEWPITPDENASMSSTDWTRLLGNLMFGLPIAAFQEKRQPTFRSLISYFVRRTKDAYSSPWVHFRNQHEWDKQVHNAFLLGLSWADASEWQGLKEQKKLLDDLKRAAKEGLMQGLMGSIGELEAARVRLLQRQKEEAEALASFRVHPQYRAIEQEATRLTGEIHQLSNEILVDSQLVEYYTKSLEQEEGLEETPLEELYHEAGLVFPQQVKRRLEDVVRFQTELLENRKSFLTSELRRLERSVAARQRQLDEATNQRAQLLKILQTHGALEEHSLLQQRHLGTEAELMDIDARLDNLKRFEEGKSSLKVDQELLHQRALRNYDAHKARRERAIELFNSYSQALYNAPGNLIIDVSSTGFRFDVEIERSQSQGISNMKIFCYDLTLASLWAERGTGPGFLIHDSTLFDGVDERQIAFALELAEQESRAKGFQYVCLLNSDTVPWGDFSDGFDLQRFVRLTLTDLSEGGSLLGIRF